MVTTFGLYATAPTQIVLLLSLHGSVAVHKKPQNPHPPAKNAGRVGQPISEERHSQQRLPDELAQNVAGWRHDSARVRITEQAFDTQML